MHINSILSTDRIYNSVRHSVNLEVYLLRSEQCSFQQHWSIFLDLSSHSERKVVAWKPSNSPLRSKHCAEVGRLQRNTIPASDRNFPIHQCSAKRWHCNAEQSSESHGQRYFCWYQCKHTYVAQGIDTDSQTGSTARDRSDS